MEFSFAAAYKQAHHPLLNFPAGPGMINMEPFNPIRRKDKVVFVIGATGTGKSKLSIDLANRFPSEIVNSDKMQVYKGLDIVTNKVTKEEQQGIPHHLLGVIDSDTDFAAEDFRHHATEAVESIVDRNRLPIIVGGSNSFIEALVNDEDFQFRSKYECCFLWVDVSLPVLSSFVSDRVNRMVEAGLIDEVRGIFKPDADYNRGIRRAIGVPELDQFLRSELAGVDEAETRARLLLKAIDEIKTNTCVLAYRQLSKIHRLRDLLGSYVHRLDATEVLKKNREDADVAWQRQVLAPSAAIVLKFLHQRSEDSNRAIVRNTKPKAAPTSNPGPSPAIKPSVLATAIAAATR
ncbi:adenylate isopentenyltransferase 5, chloroplastic-like [Macadamia integrifolia]|uniref:adenylate isopentenyltransferase 5, chloroplastic-like n=1 Tax=Macadamia integrifolia TaxID=60698 RepID=UPI001C4E5573|nr:adenylate isopentenyltransferase 5, chloroplastic-like [Macadamia integrifolia]